MNNPSIINHMPHRLFSVVLLAVLCLSDALPAYSQRTNEIRAGRGGVEYQKERRGRRGSEYKSHRYSAIDRSAHPGIWTLGAAIGATYNWQTRDAGYAYDRAYSGAWGAHAGITGTYMVQNWLSIRADILFTQKNYRMDRMRTDLLIKDIHSDYMCHYVQLPVMADWTFGSEDVKSHIYTGAYAAAWVGGNVNRQTIMQNDERRSRYEFTPEDNRADGGLVGGVGVSWDPLPYLRVGAEAMFYYSMANTLKKQAIMYDTRYNNTIVIGISTKYIF
ncbi:MAG: outer membrane beta-barrel protein [Paludibacteraceae bacterium]|nr:outer membrane beta-barrel protein [Paludibacteraceae bacterium]